MNKQDKYNASGCRDMTAYFAIRQIEFEENRLIHKLKSKYPFPPFVFICSPYAGNIEANTERAKQYGHFATMQWAYPFIPHLMYPQFLCEENQNERKLGLDMGLAFLSRCRELWYFGNIISSGMAAEIEKARRLRMVIRYFSKNCIYISNYTYNDSSKLK